MARTGYVERSTSTYGTENDNVDTYAATLRGRFVHRGDVSPSLPTSWRFDYFAFLFLATG